MWALKVITWALDYYFKKLWMVIDVIKIAFIIPNLVIKFKM